MSSNDANYRSKTNCSAVCVKVQFSSFLFNQMYANPNPSVAALYVGSQPWNTDFDHTKFFRCKISKVKIFRFISFDILQSKICTEKLLVKIV